MPAFIFEFASLPLSMLRDILFAVIIDDVTAMICLICLITLLRLWYIIARHALMRFSLCLRYLLSPTPCHIISFAVILFAMKSCFIVTLSAIICYCFIVERYCLLILPVFLQVYHAVGYTYIHIMPHIFIFRRLLHILLCRRPLYYCRYYFTPLLCFYTLIFSFIFICHIIITDIFRHTLQRLLILLAMLYHRYFWLFSLGDTLHVITPCLSYASLLCHYDSSHVYAYCFCWVMICFWLLFIEALIRRVYEAHACDMRFSSLWRYAHFCWCHVYYEALHLYWWCRHAIFSLCHTDAAGIFIRSFFSPYAEVKIAHTISSLATISLTPSCAMILRYDEAYSTKIIYIILCYAFTFSAYLRFSLHAEMIRFWRIWCLIFSCYFDFLHHLWWYGDERCWYYASLILSFFCFIYDICFCWYFSARELCLLIRYIWRAMLICHLRFSTPSLFRLSPYSSPYAVTPLIISRLHARLMLLWAPRRCQDDADAICHSFLRRRHAITVIIIDTPTLSTRRSSYHHYHIRR